MRAKRISSLAIGGAAAIAAGVLPLAQAATAQAGTARTVTAQPKTAATSLWSQKFNDQYGAAPTDVAANPRLSIVYVTGWTNTGQHEVGYPHIPLSEFTTVAYNTDTGAQLWVANYQGAGYLGQGHPLVTVSPDGSQVFVAGRECLGKPYCQVHDNEDGLAAQGYSATTGAVQWTTTTAQALGPVVMTVSPDGRELLLSGFGKYEGYVTAMINTSDGALAWAKSVVIPPHHPHYQPPADLVVSPDGSKVYVTGVQGTLALNTLDGSTAWQRYSAGSIGTSLAISQDSSELLVAGCQKPIIDERCTATALTAYNPQTGARLWALPDGATQVVASPHGPQVYVSTTSSGHTELTAFDVASGTRTQLWQTTTVSGPLGLNRQATTVFAGLTTGNTAGTGTVDGYDAATGALTSSTSFASPGFGGSLAVSTNGSKLFVAGPIAGTYPLLEVGYLTTAYRIG